MDIFEAVVTDTVNWGNFRRCFSVILKMNDQVPCPGNDYVGSAPEKMKKTLDLHR